MSVILDALKKLDREKSARRNGGPNIASEILRSEPPGHRKRTLLYFGVVSLVTAAITYALVARFGFPSRPPSPVSVTVTSPVPSQQIPSASVSSEPLPETRFEKSKVPPKIKKSVESKEPTSPAEKTKTDENIIPEQTSVAPANVRKSAEPTPTRSATTPSSLRLSGIVWSDEPSKRLAVINGTITNEGSVIEGVTVVEIHPDRVRLSHNSRFFEVLLGTSYGIPASEE